MSTITRLNFDIKSDLMMTVRRDYPLANKNLATPTDAAFLVDGEWMTLDSNGKLIRACNIASAGNLASARSFPLWMERGRSDVLSMAERKMTVIQGGVYEATTRIFDATAAVGGANVAGAAITAVMQPLKVASVTIGSKIVSGIVGHGGRLLDNSEIVGFVLELPSASNGQQLKFVSGY